MGWSFILPVDFRTIDSAEAAAMNERGNKAIEETNNIQSDISQTRTLIAANKNQFSYFNATLTPFDPEKDGAYEASNKSLRDMTYKTLTEKMQSAALVPLPKL